MRDPVPGGRSADSIAPGPPPEDMPNQSGEREREREAQRPPLFDGVTGEEGLHFFSGELINLSPLLFF